MFSSHTNPTIPVAILNISQDFTASFLQAEGKKRRGYLFPSWAESSGIRQGCKAVVPRKFFGFVRGGKLRVTTMAKFHDLVNNGVPDEATFKDCKGEDGA
jgi:hypothetical protein